MYMDNFSTLPHKERVQMLKRLKLQHKELNQAEKSDYISHCPYCKGEKVYKNGKRNNGTQMFLCTSCKKSFSSHSGTCFDNVKQKEKMEQCIQLMGRGYMSVSEMAEALDMSVMTAFNWRHKILTVLIPEEGDKNVLTIEVPLYRKGNHDLAKSHKKRQMKKVRLVKGSNNEKSASIQNEFREWMQIQMKGVSGKYLDHYAAWFRLISENVNPVQVDEILEKVMNLRVV